MKTNQKAELKQWIQHFQIQPIKCPVQNNEISTCSLPGDVYATTVSVKCQAQTGSTFMCLKFGFGFFHPGFHFVHENNPFPIRTFRYAHK